MSEQRRYPSRWWFPAILRKRHGANRPVPEIAGVWLLDGLPVIVHRRDDAALYVRAYHNGTWLDRGRRVDQVDGTWGRCLWEAGPSATEDMIGECLPGGYAIDDNGDLLFVAGYGDEGVLARVDDAGVVRVTESTGALHADVLIAWLVSRKGRIARSVRADLGVPE